MRGATITAARKEWWPPWKGKGASTGRNAWPPQAGRAATANVGGATNGAGSVVVAKREGQLGSGKKQRQVARLAGEKRLQCTNGRRWASMDVSPFCNGNAWLW